MQGQLFLEKMAKFPIVHGHYTLSLVMGWACHGHCSLMKGWFDWSHHTLPLVRGWGAAEMRRVAWWLGSVSSLGRGRPSDTDPPWPSWWCSLCCSAASPCWSLTLIDNACNVTYVWTEKNVKKFRLNSSLKKIDNNNITSDTSRIVEQEAWTTSSTNVDWFYIVQYSFMFHVKIFWQKYTHIA